MVKITTNESASIDVGAIPVTDRLAREGARRMIAEALQVGVGEYITKPRLCDEKEARAGRAQREGRGCARW